MYMYFHTSPCASKHGNRYAKDWKTIWSTFLKPVLLTCDIMTVICILYNLILFSCQQFFAWFANVEAQMEEEQESSYRYNFFSVCSQDGGLLKIEVKI